MRFAPFYILSSYRIRASVILVPFVAVATFAFSIRCYAASNATKVYAVASPAVVTVLVRYDGTLRAQGSGVIVSSDSYGSRIATNAHVVGTSKVVRIKVDKLEIDGEVLDSDDELDTALIFVRQPSLPTIRAYGKQVLPKPGSTVYAIGSPLGLDRTITSGMLTGPRKVHSEEWLQFSSQISPGSSGGGLFTEDGECIGITTSKFKEGEGLGFAIKLSDFHAFEEAAYHAGLLKWFAGSNLAKVMFGVSSENANTVKSSRALTPWLRRQSGKEAGASIFSTIYDSQHEIMKTLESYAGTSEEQARLERSGQALNEILQRYLAEMLSANALSGTTQRIYLACELTSPTGRKDPLEVVIDEKSKTANGFPAMVTEALVEFHPAGENVVRISRITGVMTFTVGDSVFRGTCSQKSKQVF